jgi:hypothetical protein
MTFRPGKTGHDSGGATGYQRIRATILTVLNTILTGETSGEAAMTPVDETIVVHFSYRAQPEFAFTLLSDGQSAPSSLVKMLPCDDLTYAAATPTAFCNDIVTQDPDGALLVLARQEAAQRPKIRPVRHFGQVSDRTHRKIRARASADCRPVRPAHPAHLVIVSARRARPARLSVSQPIAIAITATRAALYPEAPVTPAPHYGLRAAAHFVAITGVVMSLTESAVAQQMLALF